MGCCFSSLPPADEFLVDGPEPPTSLAPGFPRHVHIEPWAPHITKGPVSRAIVDANSGSLLATIHLPEPNSFGVGATVVDSAGQPLAFLMTGEKERKEGFSKSSYKIYSPRPLFVGQAPVPPTPAGTRPLAVPGTYHWATVTRAPFTFKTKVTDANGSPLGEGFMYMGFKPQLSKFTRNDGTGAMWCGKTSDKRHDVRVANGADALLAICIMFAQELADDELVVHESGGAGM